MGLNLESTISLNSASFERGMNRVKDSVTDSIKNFAIGAIGVATVEQAFHKTMETADELVNSAKRLSMTVEQVQLLRQAAKDAGKEFDVVAASLEKIDMARSKALGGDKNAMSAFATLGVSKKDLETKTSADLFTQNLSDVVKRINPEQIAGPLREVLGRIGGQSIAILKTNFDELGKTMEESGAIMKGDVAAKLHALSDAFSLVSQVAIVQLAPALLKLAQWALQIGMKTGGQVATTGAELGDLSVQLGQLIRGDIKQINWKQNDAAGSTANKSWADALKAVQDDMAKAAAALEHPKPNFTAIEQEAKAKAVHERRERPETDSMVKVGNFLGTNRGAINTSQSRMEQHAKTTADNTKKISDALSNLIARKQQREHTGNQGWESSIWPVN